MIEQIPDVFVVDLQERHPNTHVGGAGTCIHFVEDVSQRAGDNALVLQASSCPNTKPVLIWAHKPPPPWQTRPLCPSCAFCRCPSVRICAGYYKKTLGQGHAQHGTKTARETVNARKHSGVVAFEAGGDQRSHALRVDAILLSCVAVPEQEQ
jgi:hypothetical protein